MASTTAAKAPKQPSAIKTAYLVLYNLVSAILWATVFGRTVATVSTLGPRSVFVDVGEFTKWTQTLAAMEVLHSLLGVVRAPFVTTIMQVSSRFLLVWGIVQPFPFLALSPFYSSMLLAWSTTEVIRYSFFAITLSGFQPRALTSLRYNSFWLLYPLGISSECALIYQATGPAAAYGDIYVWVLYGILAIYVPGSYILFTHMMAQRKKVLRSLKAKDEKATQ